MLVSGIGGKGKVTKRPFTSRMPKTLYPPLRERNRRHTIKKNTWSFGAALLTTNALSTPTLFFWTGSVDPVLLNRVGGPCSSEQGRCGKSIRTCSEQDLFEIALTLFFERFSFWGCSCSFELFFWSSLVLLCVRMMDLGFLRCLICDCLCVVSVSACVLLFYFLFQKLILTDLKVANSYFFFKLNF